MKALYISATHDVNQLQTDIMLFVDVWVHKEKTPVPLKEIIAEMKRQGIKEFTTIDAIKALVHKKYLRKAIMISKSSFYVQLRRV